MPFRNVSCSDAAGTERPYSRLAVWNKYALHRFWSNDSQSPYFNVKVRQMHGLLTKKLFLSRKLFLNEWFVTLNITYECLLVHACKRKVGKVICYLHNMLS